MLGECYIHEMIDSETMNNNEIPMQVFEIR